MLMNLQYFAHKKGGGSTSNGRDSRSKRLGAKSADGQTVNGGAILYRQRGTRIYQVLTLVWVAITRCLLKLQALLNLNAKAATKNKLVFIQLLNNQ